MQQSLLQAQASATIGIVPTSALPVPSTFVTVTRAVVTTPVPTTGFSTVVVTQPVAVATSAGAVVVVPVVNSVLVPVVGGGIV